MSSDPFYKSAAWIGLRRSIIRTRPVCEVPGCTRKSGHVDHRLTRHSRPDLSLSPTNLMALCHHHHSVKTARHDGGFGNPITPSRPLPVRGCDHEGNPIDPNHHWNR